MSGYTAEALEKKLTDLNNSQQSIQTLSLWLIHYRKHHKSVVQTWLKSLKSGKTQAKKLTLMYLANDVIQNSRKKGPEYSKEFSGVLKQAFDIISRDCDDSTWSGLEKIIRVWNDRNIYDKKFLTELNTTIGERKSVPPSDPKKDSHKRPNKSMIDNRKVKQARVAEAPKPVAPAPFKLEFPEPKDGVTIDPDQMMKALQGLEKSASRDAAVREKIASFPPEVTDPSLVDKIRDKNSAEKLQRQLEEACGLLSDYNGKLSQELEDRKTIGVMLATLIKNQKDHLSASEQKLSEYKEKLKKVSQVKNELKSHLQNLPDLRMLPSVMAPLPSAGDLFQVAHGRHYTKPSSSVGSSSASPSTSSPVTPTTPNS